LTEDLEEEIRVLRMADSVGLSTMYDATIDSYTNWRNKVLTFAQLLKEHELAKTIRPNTDNRL
jgi:hypothetical protein